MKFCKASVTYLSPSLLVISMDLSTAWLALGLQHCLEWGHCVMDKAGRDVFGFGEQEVEGQQVEAFTALTDSKSVLLLYTAGLYLFSVLRCCESKCQHLYIVYAQTPRGGWTGESVFQAILLSVCAGQALGQAKEGCEWTVFSWGECWSAELLMCGVVQGASCVQSCKVSLCLHPSPSRSWSRSPGLGWQSRVILFVLISCGEWWHWELATTAPCYL